MKKIIKPADLSIPLGKEELIRSVITNVSARTKVFIGNETNKSIIIDLETNVLGGLNYDSGRGFFPVKEEYEIWYEE